MNGKLTLRASGNRVLLLILCFSLLASVVAACAGPAATPTTTPAPTPAPSPTPTPTPTVKPPTPSTTSPTPSPTPKPTPALPGGQGTLNLTDSGPVTLDPALAADISSASYIVEIFSGLVRLDEDLKIAPDIAEKWDRSADGKTYTFRLRQDAKFHDGRAVKAADFKYSWERALNPATHSLTAATYLNDIVGSAEMLSGRTTQLSGARVVDGYTIEVKIDAPKAYFLEKMSYPTAFVVDRANVQSGGQWWQRPNGTGPFKLGQWQKDQQMVLQRNPDYHGDKALLNQVVFKLLSGGPLQQYQGGSIDVAEVGADYLGLVTDPGNPVSKELKVFPQLSLSYIGFNAATPPFDDVNVRRAFTYAIDKERVNALAMKGAVSTAHGILPPGMPGYNAGLQGLRFDPAKAKQMIAASRYGDVSKLPPIILTTSGWGGNISGVIGGVIEEWRRNLGVQVTVRQLETEAFLYALNQEKNDLFDNGWIADYPDPQDFLDVLFRTGMQNNTGGYSSPTLDALLDEAAIEPNPDTRLKMYQDAERMIVEEAAMLPLSFGRSYVLIKPYVKGYVVSPLGFPQLNKVSIQK